MGVNMPAKTVAFDSVEKFDGNSFRNLLPTEYIQMAGRAGRRGHDDTGTVIILCKKNSIADEKDLKEMTLGAPQNLVSKFKVTYSMVLHLKRLNEAIPIGEMMRRSFREVKTLTNLDKNKNELDKVLQLISETPPLGEHQKEFELFYDHARYYLDLWKDLRPYMFELKKAVKAMVEGRILLVSYKHHINKLAIFLGLQKKPNEVLYKVFVLTSAAEEEAALVDVKSDLWYDMIALTRIQFYQPPENPTHQVIFIPSTSIIEVTNLVANVNTKLILADWDKRQIPRFK